MSREEAVAPLAQRGGLRILVGNKIISCCLISLLPEGKCVAQPVGQPQNTSSMLWIRQRQIAMDLPAYARGHSALAKA